MATEQPDLQIPTDIMDRLLQVTSASPGEATFKAAVKSLATLLGVKCAFVTECHGEPPDKARTLALWLDGAPAENIEYSLVGTPCERVYDEGMCVIERGVRHLYPEDRWLTDVRAESYIGLPFSEANGRRLGHLGMIHDEPLEETLQDRALFRLFAALVGAELVARNAESCRLELERKMLEGHRLESLGVLAGGVAHDFNNLLVGLTGNISLALMDTPPSSPIRHHLEEIDKTVHRAAGLAKQMLAQLAKSSSP